jgi:hypothetical protein
MKNFIRKQLRENLRIPSEYNKVLSDSDKDLIKHIPYNEIELNQVDDNGKDIINLSIGLKDVNVDDSIVLDIQLIKDELYLILNLLIDYKLQNLGLGYKIIKQFIEEFGHGYFSNDKIVNDVQIPRIIVKLKSESDFVENDNGIIIIKKNNQNKEELINIFNSIS